MRQQEVFKKIGSIFHELTEQYEQFRTSADNLNELELEIFVANIHFLKDHAEILRKLNAQNIHSQFQLPAPPAADEKPAAQEAQPAPEPKYFEPVVQQIKQADESFYNQENKYEQDKAPEPQLTSPATGGSSSGINLHSDTAHDSYSYVREEEGTIRHELILDEADNWDDEDEVTTEPEDKTPTVQDNLAQKVKEEEATPAPEPVSQQAIPTLSIYADLPESKTEAAGDRVLTLNERMSARLKEQNTAPVTPLQSLPDIKAAINLNDKMLFVKDLFNGYTLAYTEAVDIVNRFNNFEEADRFLQNNYAVKNNWETKKATADKFYALIKRRYA